MRLLVAGLLFTGSWQKDWQVPTTGAIAQVRQRLGAEPFAAFVRAGRGSLRAAWHPGQWPGTGLVTPKKKPEGGELTASDKEYNSQISSLRATVGRLVAHFKNWKIFHADYRRPYRTYFDAFDAARGLFFFSITWGFE